MERTITCTRHLAEHACMPGSRFHDVNLAESVFDDVNMSKVRFHDINMSDISVSAVQMGGATFKHIGLPPGSKGRQRPLAFEEADLNRTKITRCDLANVRIRDCNLKGMTIDGLVVTDLIEAYKRRKRGPGKTTGRKAPRP